MKITLKQKWTHAGQWNQQVLPNFFVCGMLHTFFGEKHVSSLSFQQKVGKKIVTGR